mmetsp:Transcript_58913/g.135955  ORF Transcript_58913/g.135955 Transcript_58913/m.135955 type:complete len:106 (-) Transcript_58913:361-678(-)
MPRSTPEGTEVIRTNLSLSISDSKARCSGAGLGRGFRISGGGACPKVLQTLRQDTGSRPSRGREGARAPEASAADHIADRLAWPAVEGVEKSTGVEAYLCVWDWS